VALKFSPESDRLSRWQWVSAGRAGSYRRDFRSTRRWVLPACPSERFGSPHRQLKLCCQKSSLLCATAGYISCKRWSPHHLSACATPREI